MKFIRAFCIALSMYSRIPVPHFEWKEEDMKYPIVFFPFVGVIVSILQMLFFRYFKSWELPLITSAVIMCIIPFAVAGWIHMDGYMDTEDALASGKDREGMLQIMKDAHTGAKAVISMIIYCAILFAAVYTMLFAASERPASLILFNGISEPVNNKKIPLVWGLGFILSRVMSAMAAVSFECADKKGTLYRFSGKGKKDTSGICRCILIIWLAVTVAFMLNEDLMAGSVIVLVMLLIFIHYWAFTKKRFGGITGDTAGWFLCRAELWMSVTAAFIAVIR
ncbi:MAG: adenosylcobinamide-GDP ribazoletransferase [Lachnospiraceae bacterium]|nr:adenosylcobinamide-GDP ribazoletransferase [Lachnospiraceae bacterium]